MVVELIKRAKNAVTLAIGDGANDVSMIKGIIFYINVYDKNVFGKVLFFRTCLNSLKTAEKHSGLETAKILYFGIANQTKATTNLNISIIVTSNDLKLEISRFRLFLSKTFWLFTLCSSFKYSTFNKRIGTPSAFIILAGCMSCSGKFFNIYKLNNPRLTI